MPTFAAKCPNCGYDFPLNEKEFREQLKLRRQSSDFSNSALASIILAIASVLMAIGSVISLVGVFLWLSQAQWLASFSCLLSAIFMAAFSITFTKILNMR